MFDRFPNFELSEPTTLKFHFWKRREIENYLCHKDAILDFAEQFAATICCRVPPEEAREFMVDCIYYMLPVNAPGDFHDLIVFALKTIV